MILKKSILSIMSTLSIFAAASRRGTGILPVSHGRDAHATTARRAGYTLVEIAFASFVVGVAFLALVGLGRLAVQNAVDAENDTRCALLAEDVFATLRATSDTLCATGGPAAWAAFWTAFTEGAEVAVEFQTAGDDPPARYVDVDVADADATPLLYGDGTTTRLKFVARDDDDNEVPQWTAQISLTASATNTLYEAYGGNDFITGPATNLTLVSLSLHIWPSAYDRRERSHSFFTHISYQGLHHGQPVE